MPHRPINASDAHVSPHYNQAIEVTGASRTLYVSGQVPVRADGTVPDTFGEQARVVFASIAAQLRAAGMGVEHIVTMTSFVVSRDHVVEFRKARDALFKGHLPASTLVFAELVDPVWMLEVNVTAAV